MNARDLTVGIVLMLAGALIAMITPSAESAPSPSGSPSAALLVTGLEGATGSTSGLPKAIPTIGIGGAIDVAFIGETAYVLVTLVSHDVGGSDVDGIYRVDGPDSFTVVANIGDFNKNNPSTIPFPFFIPTGVQYALQAYRGGFLVTDGHLNRVLRVTLDGEVTVLIAFDDIVPTGLAVSGNTVYMAEAGPVPHLPQDGKVVAFAFGPKSPTATEVASGASLLVDVEFGRGRRLYALSQGRGCPAPLRVLRRSRTPARSWRSTGTAPSPSSRTVWTGRPRSSSSGPPRTSSPSPGRSGRSTASRVRPTACRVEQPEGLTPIPGFSVLRSRDSQSRSRRAIRTGVSEHIAATTVAPVLTFGKQT
jgi:hypothetical protein